MCKAKDATSTERVPAPGNSDPVPSWLATDNHHLDTIDQDLLAAIVALREQLQGPRIGDYVLFASGQLERFSHQWPEGMQTSPMGSFYLSGSGRSSFSGGLNPATPIGELKLTPVSLHGQFWFFHHGRSGAGRGVYFMIPCRVFRTAAPYTGFLGAAFQPAPEYIEPLKAYLARQFAACSEA